MSKLMYYALVKSLLYCRLPKVGPNSTLLVKEWGYMVDVYMLYPIFLYAESESENRISEFFSGKKFAVHTFAGNPGNLYRTFSRSGSLTGF